ncbi:hypothetical protein V6R21_32265 [Limibacter armeniacum]|uniref:hypothetical protein n=1 Tax=Limibacter armeniacum TaxID=466084 RepID=UPI002FE65F84
MIEEAKLATEAGSTFIQKAKQQPFIVVLLIAILFISYFVNWIQFNDFKEIAIRSVIAIEQNTAAMKTITDSSKEDQQDMEDGMNREFQVINKKLDLLIGQK